MARVGGRPRDLDACGGACPTFETLSLTPRGVGEDTYIPGHPVHGKRPVYRPPMTTPRGMGVYVWSARQSAIGTPKALSTQLAAAGIRWVAFGGPWQGPPKKTALLSEPAQIRVYADALAAAGIESHVWGYPWWSEIDLFAAKMKECTSPNVRGWLLDPEKGLRSQPAAMRALVRGSLAAMPGRSVGLTSFARTSLMGDVPWAEMAKLTYGSPQLYTVDGPAVEKGLDEWAAKGFAEIIPSFGFHAKLPLVPGEKQRYRDKRPRELDDHFATFIDPAVPVRAMIGWMHKWIADDCWDVVLKWSKRLDRGVLAVP